MTDSSKLRTTVEHGLQTEFYHLVQSALYHADGMWGEATVDVYFTDLPPNQGFLVAAGIQAAIDSIVHLQFTEEDIEWLEEQAITASLRATFSESLRQFAFSGDIWAVQEGTPIVPNEPILRITAPLPHIALFELLVTQAISFATGVATQADRLVRAAQQRPILDFGSRRYHSAEAGIASARAAWIAGCDGTTHAHAARVLDIPAVGVISDTILAAYNDEPVAYQALRANFPNGCHINLPTHDLLGAVDNLEGLDTHIQAVRIDSDVLDPDSRAVRAKLDSLGLQKTQILGSGSLDPQRIEALIEAGAPIDGFAIGRALGEASIRTSAPLSYRMAQLVRGTAPAPVRGHWSTPWPGRKQVHRFPDHDRLAADIEGDIGGTPLLRHWVRSGTRILEEPSLGSMRAHCRAAVDAMPANTRRLVAPDPFPVRATRTLQQMSQPR